MTWTAVLSAVLLGGALILGLLAMLGAALDAHEHRRRRDPTSGHRIDWLTPRQVEALIDEAGREAVFARARSLGWADGSPPLWVWAEIAIDLLREPPK